MPVYEYACSACGGTFEAMRKFSDPDLAECRLCGASAVRKVLSAPSFVLKGSGWYATDYPSADRKQAAAAEQPSASCAGSPAPACGAGACAGGACPSKS